MAEFLISSTSTAARTDSPYILEVEHISKGFPGQRQLVLQEVAFRLPQGDILGIVGPSGCGKTTLLRTIAGFEQPDSGRILLGGRVVAGEGQWIPPERRGVGLVFQDFALFPHLDVLANVMFGLRPTALFASAAGGGSRSSSAEVGGAAQQARERADEVLRLVGLEDYAHRYPHELSGGQQQRVALARALAPKPSLILLDEPLSNLDVQVRYYLREEIRKILKQTQTSAIFVTHDQEEALCLSDWVAVMREGRIEQWGSPEEVYREPATRFVAEFIAQANFLRCERREFGWQAEGLLHIPFQALRDQPDPHLRQGELMIRQEELRLHPNPQGRVTIRDRQFLGREYRYCLVTETGKQLHALAREALPVGTRVQVTVEQGRLFPISEPQSVAGSGSKSFA
ncbi:iron(III) transport system ATP-binding protein [Thermostichus sp. MS-CIW-21]|jgi:iron(III) transport system ATP-binding protein|uniref:ABC transporter ATP-binding protein n=1 Tax=unclassified Synechococcus TaxID=2626047 RepID=UPI0000694901|nr:MULTISPECIES: ABC transporter ATP-binding protein [unclassified Synechococcus]ABD00896.1 ferric iron ABC transporter (FeT) family, ATP-binding protein [Synechococcus sp. JA-3-3Ab]PIK86330.1 ABC transporter [Synechococcus sp. 63AY4M2]PIK89567.1 ABC transporter [Synechococcus sp. 65AY6A5]PIK91691.1 ABC transporter [Synechococcus sp. 65AY6Li]PIK95394.1 ABC transporter [Synechococcus sp. 60AY4M2]